MGPLSIRLQYIAADYVITIPHSSTNFLWHQHDYFLGSYNLKQFFEPQTSWISNLDSRFEVSANHLLKMDISWNTWFKKESHMVLKNLHRTMWFKKKKNTRLSAYLKRFLNAQMELRLAPKITGVPHLRKI